MAPLTKFLVGTLLSGIVAQVAASPFAAPVSQYTEHAMRKRAGLNVVKRTVTSENTVIDWVPIESQGKIATAPPAPPAAKHGGLSTSSFNGSKPMAELQYPGAELGPPGTVPIPQVSAEYLANVATKSLPDLRSTKKRQNQNVHWYVSSNQNVNNIGGSAVYSLYKAYVANGGDFSLLQTAVTKSSTSKGSQTLEAGWINYPNQVSQPHLFTFYTTNGYANQADNQGGWNQDVAGWVQTDSQIFPGTVFSPLSTDGGDQYEIQIQYQLFQGNWWLFVLDRWIGYYPASLFSNGVSGSSLATGSDVIFYYGEIYQNEGPLTTTDMGSGRFANTGFGHSAYIHNMVYQDGNGYHDYTAGFWDSDSGRYSHQNSLSGTNWNAYTYLGGPGAGGVTGG
jgi:hypothetical protein